MNRKKFLMVWMALGINIGLSVFTIIIIIRVMLFERVTMIEPNIMVLMLELIIMAFHVTFIPKLVQYSISGFLNEVITNE